ncbi:MAG: SGNH/GDSL hydrolase family protein [Candidatus Accumulibacter phosphatis]|nr:SGNH/GDSL hydrolase family protein [Candidatus Accumulibacter phosphatis]
MMLKKFQKCLAISLLGVSGLLGNAHAYSDLVFFGDSLSDTGNVLSLTSTFSPPAFPTFPGAEGRFSNGPVWTEYLAKGLGMTGKASPSNLFLAGPPLLPTPTVIPIGPPGGQNFAFGGARTGLGGAAGETTGLFGQLVAWNGSVFGSSLTRAADPHALYVVFAGANDLRDARSAHPADSPTDDAERAAAAATVAANITTALGLLAEAGARHFLLANLPDLGKTPEAVALGVAAASTDVTLEFNTALAADAVGLDAWVLATTGIDLDIRLMDLYGLNERVVSDALTNGGAKYGITNVTTPCIHPGAISSEYFAPDATATGCDVANYSDPLHPSAAAHRLIGQLALSTVPEPSSLALLFLGMIAGMRRCWRLRAA